nr:flagellar hook assembly protein FlgD [uncultured Halomonas sp.]
MASTIDAGVLGVLNGGGAASQARAPAQELSDSFMTLLVTQLQNQDPLKPMENSEMTSQLAQINTVQGIQDLNATLETINGQIDAGQTLQAAALIGQGVLVPGDRVLVGKAGEEADGVATTPFGVELKGPADEVKITITNEGGEVVRTFDVGALDAGVQSFAWDGKVSDAVGAEDVATGEYQVSVEASFAGEPVTVTTLNYAVVGGVIKTDSGPRLDLGAMLGQVDLEAVRQIL